MENFINFFLTNHFGVDLVLLCVFSSELKDYAKRLHELDTHMITDNYAHIISQVVNFILLVLFIAFIIIDYLQPSYDLAKYYYFLSSILFGIAWLWPIDKDD